MVLEKLRQLTRPIRLPGVSSYRGLKLRGSQTFIVFTISLAVFTDIFLYGVIIPVIPFAFVSRMNVNPDDVQMWVSKSLAVYSAGLIAGSIVFGALSDRMGNRRESMLGGLVLLIASTLILCLTKSLGLFNFGRLVQGLSASIVWTVGLAVIADTAEPDRVAYLMSFPGIGLNLGLFLGPLLGGIVYERSGYYPVFYLCFALLVFDIALRMLMIEKQTVPGKLQRWQQHKARRASATDTLPGPVADIEVMRPAQSASEPAREQERVENNAGSESESDARPDSERDLAANEPELNQYSPGRISAFIKRLPPIFLLLTNSRILTSLFQSLVLAWIMTGFDATLTLHLKNMFGFNSLSTSLMFLALAVPSIFEPITGLLSDKFGPRFFVAFGLLLTAPFVILLRLPDHKSTQQIVEFAALLAVAGLGLTCVFSPMLSELSTVVSAIEAKSPGVFGPGRGFGQVYGLFNVAFSLGSLIGPFQAGATVDSVGWGTLMVSLGVICAACVVPTLLFTGGSVFEMRRQAKARQEATNEPCLSESSQAA